ncbi:MAG TPA: hypothetical protein ENI89_06540 [Desulfobulbus sp.]|nr:hypothetical protein [Desulfobulbus sp.]
MTNIHQIRTDWLFDGTGGRARSNMLLTIRNGMFERIEEYRHERVINPSRFTDLSSPATILPPLVDCHVHLAWSASTDQRVRKEQQKGTPDQIRRRIAQHIHHHFIHGILAVRDGGDRAGHGMRHQNNPAPSCEEPVVVKSGPAFCRQGRYGKGIGQPVQEDESPARAFSRFGTRCDHVKVINSGINSLTSYGRETQPQFTLAELRALVRHAHRIRKKVMVHANGREPVRLALEAGCDSLEHGFFMGRDNLRRMADLQTTWVPTVHAIRAMADPTPPRLPGIDPEVAKRTLDHQLEQLALAREFGVRIALGTDAGCPGVLHGEAMVGEIRLFLEAGFPLTTVLRLASIHGARLLGLDHDRGIEPGRPAHFLVVRALPALLPERLTDLQAIYLEGRRRDLKILSSH